jgi:hypothetical protein
MTEQAQTQEAEVKEVQEQAPQPGADLNVSDLVALRNVVDVASQRGAFKASELEMVGKVYNKLNTFLESVGKKQEA